MELIQVLFGVALVNIMTFSTALSELIKYWTAVETSVGAVSRIQAFVEKTPSENLKDECRQVHLAWPSKGQITVSDVSASYNIDQAPELRNINLNIAGGQRIGICGPSGSGKSSFIALLCHMMEINEGSITIDDVDFSTILRQKLRNHLNIIPQDPIFLKGTIRQNVDALDLAENDSAIEAALHKVGLWSIVTNAGGLDVQMEAEDLLSHGQRQLFCLARALLRPSKILIIDEATASVDLQTDELMQRIILERFTECTIISVAHRLRTIRNFDRIVVFADGRIVEYGEPDKLLELPDGEFNALWES